MVSRPRPKRFRGVARDHADPSLGELITGGRLTRRAEHRQLVPQDDDFKFLVLRQSDREKDQLQNAVQRDVKDRQEHGASEEFNGRRILRTPNFRTPQVARIAIDRPFARLEVGGASSLVA